jgi:hypothetical protein
MPAHDGLWSNKDDRRAPVRRDAPQGYPKQPITRLKRGRLFARFIAISCCRSARFSRTSSRCPRSPSVSARPTTSNSWSMSRSWLARAPESTQTGSGESHLVLAFLRWSDADALPTSSDSLKRPAVPRRTNRLSDPVLISSRFAALRVVFFVDVLFVVVFLASDAPLLRRMQSRCLALLDSPHAGQSRGDLHRADAPPADRQAAGRREPLGISAQA